GRAHRREREDHDRSQPGEEQQAEPRGPPEERDQQCAEKSDERPRPGRHGTSSIQPRARSETRARSSRSRSQPAAPRPRTTCDTPIVAARNWARLGPMPRESKEAKSARARRIVDQLDAAMPEARIALEYQDELQLLVSVMLSAQTT